MHSRRSRTRAFSVGNPGVNNASPLQRPSVYHNPSCDGMQVMLKKIEYERRIWSTSVAKKRLSVIYTFQLSKKNVSRPDCKLHETMKMFYKPRLTIK